MHHDPATTAVLALFDAAADAWAADANVDQRLAQLGPLFDQATPEALGDAASEHVGDIAVSPTRERSLQAGAQAVFSILLCRRGAEMFDQTRLSDLKALDPHLIRVLLADRLADDPLAHRTAKLLAPGFHGTVGTLFDVVADQFAAA